MKITFMISELVKLYLLLNVELYWILNLIVLEDYLGINM